MSNGSSVLPTFDQWSESCSSNFLDMNNPLTGIDVMSFPPWANMAQPNPTDTTFDVGAAIMSNSFLSCYGPLLNHVASRTGFQGKAVDGSADNHTRPVRCCNSHHSKLLVSVSTLHTAE